MHRHIEREAGRAVLPSPPWIAQTPEALPLLLLARGVVLLPGLVQRTTVTSGRLDIPALLAHVYERAAAKGSEGRIDGVSIGCVPVASPLVGPAGQLLIKNGEDIDSSQIPNVHPALAHKDDVFSFGVAAKIIGIDGRGSGEFGLRVQGTSRVRIDKVTRERPFFEAKVSYFTDTIDFSDKQLHDLFGLLKIRSRELVIILRMTSLLPRGGEGSVLPSYLARRLEQLVMRRQVKDAGLLADFMANLVETSHEEKLGVLAALDVTVRITKVIELLERQLGGFKNNIRITIFTSIPARIVDRVEEHPEKRHKRALQAPSMSIGPWWSQNAAGGTTTTTKRPTKWMSSRSDSTPRSCRPRWPRRPIENCGGFKG